jgi:PAS domain S-box-containing protein
VREPVAEALFTLDPSGRVSTWNVGAEWFTGYASGEALGRALTFLSPAGTALTLEPLLRTALDRGRVELTFPGVKQGTPYTAACTITALLEERGHTGFAVSLRPVRPAGLSAPDAAELARLRAVVDSAIDGVIVADTDGNLLEWNPSALRMHGYASLDEVRRNVSTFTDTFVLARSDGAPLPYGEWPIPKLMRGETLANYELHVCRLDTSTEWIIRYDGAVIPNPGGGAGLIVLSLHDMTERKRAEAALVESERRLEAAQRMAHVGWWDRDLGTGRLTLSEEACRIFGLPPGPRQFDRSEWHGLWEGVIHQEDREKTTRAAAEALAGGPSFDTEYRVVWPTGAVRVVHSLGDVARDEAGRPVRMFGTMQDITELRQAERELRASEARFRTFVDHAADAFFLQDDRAVVVDVNRQASASLGYSREELIGRSPLDFDPAVDPAALNQLLARLDAGEVLEFDTVHRRRDGTAFPVEIRIRPFWEGGKRFAVALVRDTTERKRAEEALRESYGLLTAVIEGTADAVFVKDLQGRYLMVNSAGARLLGRPASALVGKDDRELRSPDAARAIMERDAQVTASGQVQTFEEVVMTDGTTKTYLTTKSPFRDARGAVAGVVAIARDVTELKRLEEQFRQSQKMEAIGRLAGGVAHDFNNLLTVINGYADLVLGSTAPTSPSHAPVHEIRNAGERAAGLTAQLLAFSRKAIIEPKVLNLYDVVSQSAKLLRRLIGEDVTLATVLAPALPRVRMDPGQLEQVLLNLAVNARDAMPMGGRLTIETSGVRIGAADTAYPDLAAGRYVRVAVTDTGIGMSAEVMGRIFEPFFTTKGLGKGSGLGLAMVYGIVKTYGGHIGVESTPGAGTTFTILLPALAESPSAAGPAGVQGAKKGTETVLLVEDEVGVRGVAKLALELHGYTVLEAGGGAEAIRVVEQHPGPIHVLVTDVVMPNRGGREVAADVRLRRPQIRVLYMSGYTDDAVVRHGIVEATDAFLQKPFTPLLLARKVREVLDGPA